VRRLAAAAVAATAFAAGVAWADEPNKAEPFEMDYTVPQTPAFDFLGASPSQVARPGTLRDLGVDLFNGIGSDGTVKQGFALEVRPTPLFWAPNAADARSANIKYVLSRLHVSAGTQKVAAGPTVVGNPTDVAFGVRWTLIDYGDAWSDPAYRDKVAAVILECAPAGPSEAGQSGESLACMGNKFETLRKAYEAEHWNAFRVEVGAAGGFRLADSTVSGDLFWLGEQAWVATTLPVKKILPRRMGRLVQLDAAVRFERRIPDQFSGSEQQLAFGARFYLGADRFHLFAEGLGEVRNDSAGDDSDFDWGVGTELRVYKQSWLAVGLGNALDDDGEVHVLANMRWLVSDKEHFKRPE
jgi:hypothetical protein